jgi:hypothetical protein
VSNIAVGFFKIPIADEVKLHVVIGNPEGEEKISNGLVL